MKTIALGVVYSRIHTLLPVLLIIIFGSAGTWAATAATEKDQKNGMIETKDSMQTKIEAINARQGIDEATKSKILKVYQSAQDNLGNIEAFKVQATDFKKAIQQAPEKTKKLQKEIDQNQLKLTKQK
ncbi:MAG: mechanosensitive ion channel domain-containing protein, partial [Methylobacter sp.]